MASFGFRGNEKKHRFTGRVGAGGEPKDDEQNCINNIKGEAVPEATKSIFSNLKPQKMKEVKSTPTSKPNSAVTSKPDVLTKENEVMKANGDAVVTITMKNSLFRRVLAPK